MRLRWRNVALLLAFIGAALPVHDAFAQIAAGSRTIRLIAPVPPGSPPDVVARLLAEPLARALGHPVIVQNLPGANQTIGLAAVASSSADGYTLGLVSLPTAVVPSLMAKMPYDTLRDFAPVREIAWTSNVLVVRGDSQIASIDDLVRAGKSHPGKLSFASGGNGTPAHVLGELFRQQVGIDALHIPFKGSVEGVTAVMAGHVDFMLASAGAVAPYVRAGKLRALAQTTQARLPLLADVPTFGELGYARITVRDWQGIVAPAGTAPTVLRQLSTSIAEAITQPETQERLRTLGMEPVADSSPGEFADFLHSELERWAEVARRSGLEAQ